MGLRLSKQDLELNRKLTDYSRHEDENSAYHAMQSTAFLIAELLMDQPKGTMTTAIAGHKYWVSPVKGMLEILCSPDLDYIFSGGHSYSVFLVSDFSGLGVDDLHQIRAEMTAWLHTPSFEHCKDAGALDRIVRGVMARAA